MSPERGLIAQQPFRTELAKLPFEVCSCEQPEPNPPAHTTGRRIIMSGSLHPAAIHLRRHRKRKRAKLRARLAATPAVGHAAIQAKLERTYSFCHMPAAPKPPPVAI